MTDVFVKLEKAGEDLNAASNQLGDSVTELNAVLQKFSLGVAAWTWVAGRNATTENMTEWSREVGYAKVGKKWGLALRSQYVNEKGEREEETWLFSDGPRWMRAEAVGKIPELLEHLVERALETAELIRKKSAELDAFVTLLRKPGE